MIETIIALSVAFPFIIGLFIATRHDWKAPKLGQLALTVPIICFLSLLYLKANLPAGESYDTNFNWIPSMGINIAWVLDGYTTFWALLVSGVGVLVFFFAYCYFGKEYKKLNRFYCYLLLFMGSMLGAVLSNNLLVFFIFWEFTSVTSFFLIGFRHYQEFSRNGARMAFLTTAATSLFMLSGFIVLAQVAGTMNISQLLSIEVTAENNDLLELSFVLILIGAMGKSAQFPFHYWLPSAMAAPAPVSAYLHSATMVKLGVFTLGKFYSLYSQLDIWAPALICIGSFTFLVATTQALLTTNIKGILANSTVAQLGFLFFYYGFTSYLGLAYDYLHILNHVFYKASLFMVAGIIFEATGAIDLKQTGGNLRRMPILAFICLVGTCTMAGIAGTSGFISKEYSLKALYEIKNIETSSWFTFAFIAFVVGSIFKVVFSARLFLTLFIFKPVDEANQPFNKPTFGFQLPALLLAFLAIITGLMPFIMQGITDWFGTKWHYQEAKGLYLWHGWNSALATSIVIVILGALGTWFGYKTKWKWSREPAFMRFDLLFEKGIIGLLQLAKNTTRYLASDKPAYYLPVIAATFAITMLSGLMFFDVDFITLIKDAASQITEYPVLSSQIFLMCVLSFVLLFIASWFLRILVVSLIGFLVTFIFVFYRAPDLALTQVMVESASFLLLFLFLARIKKFKTSYEYPVFNLGFFDNVEKSAEFNTLMVVKIAIALVIGVSISGFLYYAHLNGGPSLISNYIIENSVSKAKGSNAVNTILVDFRGFDTFIEITVLLVAATGCIGLLYRLKGVRS